MLLVPLRSIHSTDSYPFGHFNNSVPTTSFSNPYSSVPLGYSLPNAIYPQNAGCLPMAPRGLSLPMTPCHSIDRSLLGHSQQPPMSIDGSIPCGVKTDPTFPKRNSVSPCQRGSSPFHDCDRHRSILYNLLNQTDQGYSSASSPASVMSEESGTQEHKITERFVGLKNPEETCNVASKVLVKTVNFIKNLESYKDLCEKDQILLFQSCWAELFIVGLAQEKMMYETVEYELTVLPSESTDNLASSLRALPILRQQKAPKSEEAAQLKNFIQRCWDLNLSVAEYAYFMGTVLFDPDVPGLEDRDTISSLQMEARHALAEYRGSTSSSSGCRHQQMRLAQILLGLPSLRSVKSQAVVNLFFRPIFGSEENIEKMLMGLLAQ